LAEKIQVLKEQLKSTRSRAGSGNWSIKAFSEAFSSLTRNRSEPGCHAPVTQRLGLDGWSEAGLAVCR